MYFAWKLEGEYVMNVFNNTLAHGVGECDFDMEIPSSPQGEPETESSLAFRAFDFSLSTKVHATSYEHLKQILTNTVPMGPFARGDSNITPEDLCGWFRSVGMADDEEQLKTFWNAREEMIKKKVKEAGVYDALPLFTPLDKSEPIPH